MKAKALLRFVSFFPLLCVCLPPALFAGPESELKTQLGQTAVKIRQAAARKPFRFTAMNESLSLTAQAVAAYENAQRSFENAETASGSVTAFYAGGAPLEAPAAVRLKDLDRAEAFFREASAKYRDNAFPGLWMAVIDDERGDRDSADRKWTAFLEKKNRYGAFEQAVLKPQEFQTLENVVRSWLKTRGITVSRPQARSSGFPWPRGFEKLGPTDRRVNAVFAVVLLLGTLGLLLAHFTGNLYPRGWPRFLTGLYFSCWAGFGLWEIDLIFGLPFHFSRFQTVPWFLIALIAMLGLREGIVYWNEKFSPVEKGYRRCRKCGGVFPELMRECPDCRQRTRN